MDNQIRGARCKICRTTAVSDRALRRSLTFDRRSKAELPQTCAVFSNHIERNFSWQFFHCVALGRFVCELAVGFPTDIHLQVVRPRRVGKRATNRQRKSFPLSYFKMLRGAKSIFRSGVLSGKRSCRRPCGILAHLHWCTLGLSWEDNLEVFGVGAGRLHDDEGCALVQHFPYSLGVSLALTFPLASPTTHVLSLQPLVFKPVAEDKSSVESTTVNLSGVTDFPKNATHGLLTTSKTYIW